jgi:tRNA threonylcarbamoyladenosine biosynthesis protein TsaE
MISVKVTKTSEETEKVGEEFARQLNPQDVIFLIGKLGSGKTTFVKGLARGLGIVSRIISPTFVVVRQHTLPTTNYEILDGKVKTLYHLDLYRLQNTQEALAIDMKDYLDDTSGIVAIEWPELSQKIVNKKVWKVKIDVKNEMREISMSYE